MVETTLWIPCDDGARLFVRRWQPERLEQPGGTHSGKALSRPLAVVQLVHGMAEHSLRYRRFAEKLCGRGFEVWAADSRGHGKTADPSVNGKDKGGLPGHTADRNGFFRVVEDLRITARHIAQTLKAEYGMELRSPEGHSRGTAPPSETASKGRGIPFFIMGHSWGSLLTQGYIEDPEKSVPLSGCILSGTRGPGGAEIALGGPFLALLAFFRGRRRPSKIAAALSLGSYNRPFRPNRTLYDWLSRDEKEVDAFMSDPLCGRPCSSGFYRDMVKGLGKIHRRKALGRIDPALPLYVFCGSADPVGNMGSSPTALVNAYRAAGIEDLEFVLYPEARHEGLNETNREEITGDILGWLLRHLPQQE